MEKEIQKAILDLLKLKGITAWRNNAGTTSMTINGQKYWMKLAPKGSPDIIGYLKDGRFLGIEVKGPKGILTKEQSQFLSDINAKGGVAFVATSVDVAVRELKDRKCG